LAAVTSGDVVRDAWLYGHDVLEVGARLGGGTVGFHPYVARLVEEAGADPARLRETAEQCRARVSTLVAGGANPRSRRVVGYARAAALLDAAAAAPCAPDADTDRPFRRLRPTWWRRRRSASTAAVVYHLAERARDVSAAQVVRDGRPLGVVRFQCCPRCRVAAIVSVEVASAVRGVGLGHRLVAAALRTAPPRAGYQWHTVGRPESMVGFWQTVGARFGVDFSHVDHLPCAHMTASRG
jgi:GNAT superfamily N-acetyltransferase